MVYTNDPVLTALSEDENMVDWQERTGFEVASQGLKQPKKANTKKVTHLWMLF